MSFVGTDAFKNVGLNAMVAAAGYLSLHTANPGSTGASEVTGGSPAYARKAATWGAAAAGQVTASGVIFDVPAGTVAYVGLWTASSGGTFRGYWPVTAAVFGGQGTYTLSSSELELDTI